MIYRFENMELDTDRFELRRDGLPCKVEPQVFSLIELLVANHQRVVTKDEINQQVWGGRVVSEAVLSSRVRTARQALGDDGTQQRLIKTLHNRGFRFCGNPVSEDNLLAPTGNIQAGTSAAAASPKGGTPQAGNPEAGNPGENYLFPATMPTAAENGQALGRNNEDHRSGRPSIAVLPFLGLCDNPRFDSLPDAIAQDLIVDLSRLRWLFVIARGSSFRFRGRDLDLGRVGQLLGVRYLLNGSLTITGRQCSCAVELARVFDDQVIWADRFDGRVDDLPAFRATITARVLSALELRIPMEEAQLAARQPTEDLDAWSAYHRGLWHMLRFNRHDNEIAGHMFARALQADPGFARAHAGMSFTHFQNAFIGYTSDTDQQTRLAREQAERCLELDPLEPFGNLTMGRSRMLVNDLGGAMTWLERSVELCPNYALAIYNQGLVDVISGRCDASESNVAKAMALSPLDPLQYAMLSTLSLSQLIRGNAEDACRWSEKAVHAPNAHIHIQVIAAMVNEVAGNRAVAENWVEQARQKDRNYSQAQFFKAFPFTEPRSRQQMRNALTRLSIT